MDKKEEKKIIRQEFLTGERALFMGKNLDIYDTIFDDGESPLKESRGINLYGSMFKWKYPLWYSKNIVAEDCHWLGGHSSRRQRTSADVKGWSLRM